MLTVVKRSLSAVGLAAVLLCPLAAEAGVVIAGTRLVFPAQESEVTLGLNNDAQRPALVQVWIDDGDQDTPPEEAKAPFVMTPPLLRMDAGTQQAVRIRFTGPAQRVDRESLYWVNVLDIPPSSGEQDKLELAFRSRIKLFYRPAGLPGEADGAHRQLRWSLQQRADGLAVQVDNPTPWHVSFAAISLTVDGKVLADTGSGMVAPRATQVFPLDGLAARPKGVISIEYSTITDVGGVQPASAALSN
ncbi:chaperone protein EcpD [Stenotrophomonas maltophilia]|uniref:fimbrial biogenesis chaperone n=1 Tax=Stenotrophomonas chelatiphaga TaxID=517011 RepID=UPI000F4C8448|nr:fimbria/pilus periplasmic chaperone [Stenotrophomonas chelatiphaga]MCS4230544.1 chaperone protein EcpD [Stenotrophomonas chelatiphaga]ROQ45526.1 chaperone protein EcpD [Stenotrophomonas maltophilia]